MELVQKLIPILLTLSLAILVIQVGIESASGDLRYVLRQPRLLIRAILAVSIIPLVAAIIVVSIFPIALPTKAAIILMAISPVPPLVPGKMLKFGGRSDYAYGLYTAMALLSVITVPFLGWVTAKYFHEDVELPIPAVAANVFVGVVIPLAIGLLLGRKLAPERSRRLAPLASKWAMVLLLLAFLPILINVWSAMTHLIGDGSVVAIIIIVVIAVTGGHLLGESSLADKSTLSFAAAMRHPGIALALAGANHMDKRVTAGVLLFLLVAILTLIPYQLLIRRHGHATPASEEKV